MNILRVYHLHIDYDNFNYKQIIKLFYILKLFFRKITFWLVKVKVNQMGLSTEYFFPLKNITHGIPLICDNHNNNITDGKIIIYHSSVCSS